jgi:hypothetical protein
MFIRFYSSDNKKICRHPISTSSILETNATNVEFNIKLSLSQSLDPVNNKLATTKYSNELSELLYHPDLTEYTAIAHLTSNTTSISETIETYSTASKIGYLVLNIPFAIYKKVDTKSVRKTINNKDINEKIKYFIKNFDRGFAFYNLINIYNNNKRSTQNLLNAANLPDEEVLSDIILYQMEQNLSKLINGSFKQMGEESILTGIEIFKKRGLFGNKTNIFEYIEGKNKMPHIIFGDTYFDTDKLSISEIQAKANSNQELSIIEKYHLLDYYQDKCTEFIDACGR